MLQETAPAVAAQGEAPKAEAMLIRDRDKLKDHTLRVVGIEKLPIGQPQQDKFKEVLQKDGADAAPQGIRRIPAAY